MQTVFHLRLLDADRQVLAWTKTPADTKGDGCLWATQAFVAECDVAGVATSLHVHWPDVHYYYTVALPQARPVTAGEVVSIPLDAPLVRMESEAVPVPPVTVRTAITVGVASANR